MNSPLLKGQQRNKHVSTTADSPLKERPGFISDQGYHFISFPQTLLRNVYDVTTTTTLTELRQTLNDVYCEYITLTNSHPLDTIIGVQSTPNVGEEFQLNRETGVTLA